jgi:Zn-dependent protease
MLELTLIQKITVAILPILFALTLKECAHGWVAAKLGDPTAKLLGRVSFNPFKHIDLLGTLILPLLLMSIGGFIFGWAKPIPITWQNLRHPKRDMAFVALAGLFANIIMAILWLGIAKLGAVTIPLLTNIGYLLFFMGQTGIIINIIIMVLNLLPLPNLDGSRILISLLPSGVEKFYHKMESYSLFIFIGVLLLPPFPPGLLGYLISPIINSIISSLVNLVGISFAV